MGKSKKEEMGEVNVIHEFKTNPYVIVKLC